MTMMSNFVQAETVSHVGTSTMHTATQRSRAGPCWSWLTAGCGGGHGLRNGWSAKTLRRISASINLIILLELYYAINMFETCFDRKGCKGLS